jgi:hypothetical protein
MSFPPLNSSAQTGLIPRSLLGYANNGDSAIQVDATTIKIGGALTTNPVTVEISADTGLTTSRAQGLNCNCDFDMNLNTISNISTVRRFDGGDLQIQTQDGGNVVLANTGTGGSINLNALDTLNLSGNTINSFGKLDMNAQEIKSVSKQKFSVGIDISDATTDAQISSNNSGRLSLGCSNDLIMNVNNNSIVELTTASLNLTGNNGISIDTTTMNFLNGIAINDTTNSIVGTTLTGLTLTSNTSISLNAPTISIPNLVVTIPSDLTLNSLTYSNGINIQDNIIDTSITSYIGGINNSTMDISVNNGDTNTVLNIYANSTNISSKLIFPNGISIMDSLSQSAPNITGNGIALQFTSQEIIFNTPQTYISSIQSNTGTLSLTSFSVTASTLNLVTSNGGTINLTASQVNMNTANASCSQVILTEQTTLPTGQAGALCYHNDSYYVYKVVGGWTLLV